MKIKKFLALMCAAATIGFATTSCSDDDNDVKPFTVVTLENATLNSDGILVEGTLIGEDDYELGNFWKAYTEEGITFKSYVATAYTFWSGFAISNHHDMTTDGMANQYSVYNATGHSGTKFVVCYDGGDMMGSGYENEIYVDNNTDKVFDHVYVTNSTYAALSMENGDGFAKQFTYADADWFKLTIKGIDHSGTVKGSIEFYLADFRTSSSSGIISEWTKVDLTSLGAVQKLQFSLSSSDNSYGYMNTPAYFCLDDIAIKQ
ncbi:MAG: DUF4465 domain-containing protein [Prevotellaceae bacterium]|jgi:hypothetical protein|nr:DUF4465 domain-containing protein [Prevotellaceae bacterium]